MNFHFDTSPTIYFGLVYLLLFVWVFTTVLQKPKQSNTFFLLIGSVFLFLGRLPVILHNKGINQDESQMLTQALTLRQDPILFQSVDTTTGGPLSSYLLSFFNLIGFQLDYSTAHLAAILLIILCFIFLYKTCQNLFDTQAARLAIIPFVLFEIFTQEPDFVHFASELVPLLLLILMLYFSSKTSKTSLFIVGFLGAMCIFGKLQALPMIAVLGLASPFHSLSRWRGRDSPSFYNLIIKIIGGITGIILLLLLFSTWGVLQDVIDYYFIRNFTAHTATRSLMDGILAFPTFIFKNIDFFIFVIASLSVVLINRSFRNWQLWLYLFVSIFSVIRTGSDYLHYLHFLIPPLVLLAAYSNTKNLSLHPSPNGEWGLVIKIILSSICFFFLSTFGYKTLKNQPTNAYPTQPLIQSNVSKEIQKYSSQKQNPANRRTVLITHHSSLKLVVWGWNLDYHIETQMPQGTRENHIPYVVLPHKMQVQERQRYLEDLKKNRPIIFVDAVGKNSHWFNDKSLYRHENFIEIKDFIENNYKLVNFVDDVRIYQRIK
jgi:hypothetical protein